MKLTIDAGLAGLIGGIVGSLCTLLAARWQFNLAREAEAKKDTRDKSALKRENRNRLREQYESAHSLMVAATYGNDQAGWHNNQSRQECLKWLSRILLDFPTGQDEMRQRLSGGANAFAARPCAQWELIELVKQIRDADKRLEEDEDAA